MHRALSPLLLFLNAAVPGAALLSTSGCGEATGVSLPDLTLKDLDGTDVALSDFEGKAVLLNFWFLA